MSIVGRINYLKLCLIPKVNAINLIKIIWSRYLLHRILKIFGKVPWIVSLLSIFYVAACMYINYE